MTGNTSGGLLAQVTVRLPGFSWTDRLKAVCGAIFGIALTGLLCGLALGGGAVDPLLVAPMGASAVLLFAVPASPLAQPWSVIGGNCVSALAAVAVTRFVADPVLATGIAVGGAIAAMTALRCLHPPGGAVALLVALSSVQGPASGWQFALFPVGINSLLLTLTALVFHRICGHSYPHRPSFQPHVLATRDKSPLDRHDPAAATLHEVLQNYGDVLDVSESDLQALFREVELHKLADDYGDIRCADIMSRDIISVAQDMPCSELRALMRNRRLSSVPVTDPSGHVAGIVTSLDSIRQGEVARDICSSAIYVHEDTLAAQLVRPLADGGRHEVLVLNANGLLTGIITQTDMIAAMANIMAHMREPV